jgi:aspartyl/asparaginyl-tRNA synthetase
MKRTLISQINEKETEKVLIKGRVINVRNLSNVVFLIVQDYTATIQVVFELPLKDGKIIEVKNGEAVEIEGSVKKEPRSKYGFEIIGETAQSFPET